MIVTCPACSVRYLVDARALGAGGRTVRCARCGHTWWQEAPPDQAPGAPPPLPPESAPPREPAPVVAPQDRVQLPVVTRPRRRWGMALVWAAVVLVVVVGLAAAAILERDRVVALFPAAGPVYALAGFPASEAGLGLVFRNVTTSRDMENGLPTLVIQGEVANVSSVARPVPKLVAILRDRGEHELQEQSFSVAAQQLLPGEAVPFQTTISQPAEEASGVIVTFSHGGG